MKIDFSKVINDLDGKPINDDGKLMTLKLVCTNALLMSAEGDEKLSGEEKYKRFSLADKLNKADSSIKLESEEISKLKELIAKFFTPLVVGRSYDILEGKEPVK